MKTSRLASPMAALAASPWARLVTGPPGPQRSAVLRLLLMAPSFLFIAALLSVAVVTGMTPPQPTGWVLAYGCAGYAAFYAALRSGRTATLSAPSLVFPHMCFNITLVVLTYSLVPLTRGLVVQWLCLLILFDMQRLSGRQVLLATAFAYGALIAAMAVIHYIAPASIDMQAEAVNIVLACLTLCTLLAVTRVGRRVDDQRKAQQAELAATVAKLDELAIHDALTGAYNRRYMQAALEEELRRRARGGHALCVALIDIDHFKQVNDRHGHAVGDTVLREVVHLLRDTLRAPHAVGRWGGEEFLVLMPESTPAQAHAAIQIAAQAVREHDWARHAAGLSVTFSGGVAEHKGRPLDDLLERADRALYAAKSAGRDRITLA